MTTSVFILLKEYIDPAHKGSVIYINGTDKINSDEFIAGFKSFMDIISFFKYEKCNRFYDLENVKGMLYPYILLEDEYNEQVDEYPDAGTFVRSEFYRCGIIDWKEEETPGTALDRFYLSDNTEVTNDMLGEMMRRKNGDEAVVLLNFEAIRMENPIQIRTSADERKTIYSCLDIPALHAWFSENRRPQRIYCYDSKHGEAGHGAQMIPGTNRRAAQLLTNRPDTERLLKLAIGIDTESSLWYYDKANCKYIYFENQQEIRLAFHGYHLSEGDENYDNIDIEKLKKVQEIRS